MTPLEISYYSVYISKQQTDRHTFFWVINILFPQARQTPKIRTRSYKRLNFFSPSATSLINILWFYTKKNKQKRF